MGSKEGGGAGSSTLDAVEAGIVLMFNDRVMAMATGWTTADLVLACCAGFALQAALPKSQRGWRGMHALVQVLKGIVLKAVLSAVVDKDQPLYLTHLLCMFLLLHAFTVDELGGTAKYVFASQIAASLARDPFVGVGLCAALQANMGLLAAMPRLQECAQLVVVQLAVRWFQDSIPNGLEFATTLLCMHLLAPMLGQAGVSPLVSEIYTLALYKASETIELPGGEAWVQAAYAILLWTFSPDPVSRLVGQFCCIQVGSALVLDAGAATLRTDPVLSAWFILTGLGVVLLLARG